MNVLHVTLGFYPAVAWGGPVKIVHQNARELVRRGHHVTVYCTNLLNKQTTIEPGTFERWIDGIRIVYFNTWHWSRWPGTLGPVWLRDVREYWQRDLPTYDVVHINGYRNLMLAQVAHAVRRLGKPIVMQPHGAIPIIINSLWIKRLYDRLLGQVETRDLDALVALQDSERQQALVLGIPEQRIHVIPNGLDVSDRSQLPPKGTFRRRWQLPPERPIILFLGRINRKKGVDMLVEAFAQLTALDAQLVIAGPDDGQLANIKQLIAHYQLAHKVILTGVLDRIDSLAAFQDADLFVLPCRADTFPTTIMEACLLNVPMVITDRCESAHMVKGRVADVTPFDASDFARAMSDLLMDRARYTQYQANCPQLMADTFSLSAVVDQLEALYRQVIAESRAK